MTKKKVPTGTHRHLETYDKETGEIMQGSFVYVPPKKKSPFGDKWIMMGQESLDFLVENRKHLGEEGFAVFCALAARLDFENYILINQAELAQKIKMDRSNLNRSLKRLVDMGVIGRGPKSGRSPTFRLNPNIGWKGKAMHHFSAIQEAKVAKWKVIQGGKSDEQISKPDEQLPFDL